MWHIYSKGTIEFEFHDIYFKKSGSEVYREESYKGKLTSHPDEIYKIMLQGEFRNREYVRDFPNLKVTIFALFSRR